MHTWLAPLHQWWQFTCHSHPSPGSSSSHPTCTSALAVAAHGDSSCRWGTLPGHLKARQPHRQWGDAAGGHASALMLVAAATHGRCPWGSREVETQVPQDRAQCVGGWALKMLLCCSCLGLGVCVGPGVSFLSGAAPRLSAGSSLCQVPLWRRSRGSPMARDAGAHSRGFSLTLSPHQDISLGSQPILTGKAALLSSPSLLERLPVPSMFSSHVLLHMIYLKCGCLMTTFVLCGEGKLKMPLVSRHGSPSECFNSLKFLTFNAEKFPLEAFSQVLKISSCLLLYHVNFSSLYSSVVDYLWNCTDVDVVLFT